MLILSGCAKVLVTPVVAGRTKAPAKGYFYALPRTVVSVSVPVERTDSSPGVYHCYAPVFFPGQAAVTKAKAAFGIGTPVISTRGEPDPDQVYMVHTSSHLFEKKTISLELTPDGILKGSVGQSDDQSFEVAMEVLKTAAALSKMAAFGGPPPPPLSALSLTPEEIQALAGLDEVQRKAYRKLTNADKGCGNIQAAREKYNAITELLAQRHQVLIGRQAGEWSKATLDTVLAELDGQIAKLMKRWFLGNQSTSIWQAEYTLRPTDPNAAAPIELFGFNEAGGLCPSKDPLANVQWPAIPPDFADGRDGACSDLTPTLVLSLPVSPGKAPAKVIAETVDAGKSGRSFYFRYPGVASAELKLMTWKKQDGKRIADTVEYHHRADVSIAQYGAVVSLPASSGGRSTKYAVKLDTATGALLSGEMNGEALVKASDVATLGTQATDLTTTIKDKKAVSAKENSEVERLKREVELLELRKRKLEAETALSPATLPPGS